MLDNIFSMFYYTLFVLCLLLSVYMISDNALSNDKRVFNITACFVTLCAFANFQFMISMTRIYAIVTLSVAVTSLLISCVSLFHFFIIKNHAYINKSTHIILAILYIISALSFPAFYFQYINAYKNLDFIQLRGKLCNIGADVTLLKILIMVVVLLTAILSFLTVLKAKHDTFLVNAQKSLKMYLSFIVIWITAAAIDFLGRMFDLNLPLPVLIISLMAFVVYQATLYLMNRYMKNKRETSNEIYIVDLLPKRRFYCLISAFILVFPAMFYQVNIMITNEYDFSGGIIKIICVFIGASVIIVQNRIQNEYLADMISNVLWAVTIPLILRSTYYNSGVIAWVLPLVFMFISCIFIPKKYIVIFAVTGVISYIIMAVVRPRNVILFTIKYHIFRILVFVILTTIVLIIHSIFVRRLREVKRHEYFQMAIVNISKGLLVSADKDIEDRLKEALDYIRGFTESVRVFVYRFNEQQSVINLFSFSAQENHTDVRPNRTVKMFELSDKFKYILKDNIITFDHSKDDEYQLLKLDSVSSIYVPMKDKDRVDGMLVLQSLEPKHFDNLDKNLLRLLSDMLNNALRSAENDKLIAHNSIYDSLTQLPNRACFTDMLNYKIERAGDDQKLTVVFIDLDAFQEINDLMGHDYGDKILIEVSKRFTNILGKEAIVSRFGGDEFLLLFNDFSDTDEIENTIDSLMATFLDPIEVDNNEVHITMSCGIAIYPQDGVDGVTLIRNADMAMNQAKAAGKNRFLFCSDDMRDNIKRKALLTEHLRRALDNNEFRMVFQPQVDAKTHRIRGAEALLRWFPSDDSELGGFVSPGEFIPILEETDLIIDVGRFVIDESIKMLSKTNSLGSFDITMAMNMSTEQFKDFGLANYISERIERYGVRNNQIDIEVTEGAYGDGYSNIKFIVNELEKLGVKISIDDFGTGYSNMSRLSHMAIDKIKIDISYVRGIGKNKKDEGIIKTIIALANSLGCTTLAEGVETDEQLEFLTVNGCELIQGYYFYKPLSADEFIETIKKENNIVLDKTE